MAGRGSRRSGDVSLLDLVDVNEAYDQIHSRKAKRTLERVAEADRTSLHELPEVIT